MRVSLAVEKNVPPTLNVMVEPAAPNWDEVLILQNVGSRRWKVVTDIARHQS